jgi:uncharacterized protein YaiI (UPF0178 family)
MKILIDGDGCPVIREIEEAASLYGLETMIFCDTSHRIISDRSQVFLVDKGADAADFALTSHISKGDVVVTQDYGLAAMALAKGAFVFHQDGWQYTKDNIDRLLMERYEAKKARKSAKHHLKEPRKREKEANRLFFERLSLFLQNITED